MELLLGVCSQNTLEEEEHRELKYILYLKVLLEISFLPLASLRIEEDCNV
jgi:hypothetical protein